MLLSKEVSYEKMFSLVLALSLLLSLSTTGYAAVNDDCNNITIDVSEEHFIMTEIVEQKIVSGCKNLS